VGLGQAGAGLCGGYVRWIEPLGEMSVESGPDGVEWCGRMEGEEERNGRVGGLERAGGARGFKPKGTATEHRKGVARLAKKT
jgi:hypothetical protein